MIYTRLYMHQSFGFHDPLHTYHVCHLRKSLFGMKETPHAWYKCFPDYVSMIEFQHSASHHFLFIYWCGSNMSCMLLCIDDIILITSSHDLRKSMMALLVFEFSMKDLCPLSYFLRIVVTRHVNGMFLN